MTVGNETTLRPGFCIDYNFKAHSTPIRHVAYNERLFQFFSVDEKCLKAWGKDKETGMMHIAYDVLFPNSQSSFVTAMTFATDLQLLFVACLDDTLRLYSEKLRLRAAMPWDNGTTCCIIYNERRAEIITAGSYGVKVWECEQDKVAAHTATVMGELDPYDMPRTKDGSVVPWYFGKYQRPVARLALTVPGSRALGAKVPKGAASLGSGVNLGFDSVGWCERLYLHPRSQTLFALFQSHVYGFELAKGACIWHLRDLQQQPISSIVWMPERDMLCTTSMDTVATLWRIDGTSATKMRSIGKASAAITHVTVDPDQQQLLAAAVDGSVTLYSLETLLPLFRMKLSRPPGNLTFIDNHRFYTYIENEVKLFSVNHLFEPWMVCSSQPVALRQLTHGLIIAELADSSIRVLDSSSTLGDKSIITTMPQLSTANLQCAVASLTRGCLFTLLSNSHVHIWELHLRKPPTFQEAWTHLAREQLTCMVYLDGGALDPAVVTSLGLSISGAALGQTKGSNGAAAGGTSGAQLEGGGNGEELPDDHVLFGTAVGDIIFCDLGRGGIPVIRFPAFKHQPVEIMALDLDRNLLCTTSHSVLKVLALEDLKCTHSLEAAQKIKFMELLEGRCILGTASGSIHVVDMMTGQTMTSVNSNNHMDCITGMGASCYLQHFVTSGQDCYIKIFDKNRSFKTSVYTGAQISALCYLNDLGDILVALPGRLVVLPVGKYDIVMQDGQPQPSMYADLQGRGRIPTALRRSMTSVLHRNTEGHKFADDGPELLRHASYTARVNLNQQQARALGIKAISEKRPVFLRSNTLAAVVAEAQSKKSGGATDRSTGTSPQKHYGDASTTTATDNGVATNTHGARGPSARVLSARRVGHHAGDGGGDGLAAQASKLTLTQQALSERPAGFEGSMQKTFAHKPVGRASPPPPVVPDLQLSLIRQQAGRPSSSSHQTAVAAGATDAAASTFRSHPSDLEAESSLVNTMHPHRAVGFTDAGGGDASSNGPPQQQQQHHVSHFSELRAAAGDAAVTMASSSDHGGGGSRGGEGEERASTSAGAAGNGGIPLPPSAGTSGRVPSPAEGGGAGALMLPGGRYRRPEWADELGPVQSSFQTTFTFNVGQELEARRRRLHGLGELPVQGRSQGYGAEDEPAAQATGKGASGGAGKSVHHFGSLELEMTDDEAGDSEGDTDDSDGSGKGGLKRGPMLAGTASKLTLPPMDGSKLSAAFRKTLPIICSHTAFLDGRVPEELMTVKKPKAKKKKRRKKAKAVGLLDPMAELYRTTRDASILTELKAVKQHGIIIRSVLPSLPGPENFHRAASNAVPTMGRSNNNNTSSGTLGGGSVSGANGNGGTDSIRRGSPGGGQQQPSAAALADARRSNISDAANSRRPSSHGSYDRTSPF